MTTKRQHDADLCERIRELEKRVRELEARPPVTIYPPVWVYPAYPHYCHPGCYHNTWTVPKTPTWAVGSNTVSYDSDTLPQSTYTLES